MSNNAAKRYYSNYKPLFLRHIVPLIVWGSVRKKRANAIVLIILPHSGTVCKSLVMNLNVKPSFHLSHERILFIVAILIIYDLKTIRKGWGWSKRPRQFHDSLRGSL